jgi:hypothetical protein
MSDSAERGLKCLESENTGAWLSFDPTDRTLRGMTGRSPATRYSHALS